MDDKETIKHVRYEYEMLVKTAQCLYSKPPDPVIMNALIESYAIHARNIIDFLFPDKPRPDDITASRFLPGWNKNLPSFLKDIRREINKRVSHLTEVRIKEGDWNVPDITKDLGKILNQFFTQYNNPKLTIPQKSFGVASGASVGMTTLATTISISKP